MKAFQDRGDILTDFERQNIRDLYVVLKGCRKIDSVEYKTTFEKKLVQEFKELSGQFKREVRSEYNIDDGTTRFNVENKTAKPTTHWTSYLDDVLLFDARLAVMKEESASRRMPTEELLESDFFTPVHGTKEEDFNVGSEYSSRSSTPRVEEEKSDISRSSTPSTEEKKSGIDPIVSKFPETFKPPLPPAINKSLNDQPEKPLDTLFAPIPPFLEKSSDSAMFPTLDSTSFSPISTPLSTPRYDDVHSQVNLVIPLASRRELQKSRSSEESYTSEDDELVLRAKDLLQKTDNNSSESLENSETETNGSLKTPFHSEMYSSKPQGRGNSDQLPSESCETLSSARSLNRRNFLIRKQPSVKPLPSNAVAQSQKLEFPDSNFEELSEDEEIVSTLGSEEFYDEYDEDKVPLTPKLAAEKLKAAIDYPDADAVLNVKERYSDVNSLTIGEKNQTLKQYIFERMGKLNAKGEKNSTEYSKLRLILSYLGPSFEESKADYESNIKKYGESALINFVKDYIDGMAVTVKDKMLDPDHKTNYLQWCKDELTAILKEYPDVMSKQIELDGVTLLTYARQKKVTLPSIRVGLLRPNGTSDPKYNML